jgi:hypothetical protein
MLSKRLFLGFTVATISLWLVGCATSPYQGDGKTRSDVLLQKQITSAETALLKDAPARLIFAGFAMHSQSKAFRNDVLSAEKVALSVDPSAVIFKLNNPAIGQDADWPYATSENIELVLKKVGSLARPQDKVMVLLATHGSVNALAINFSAQNYPHLNAVFLNRAMADLRGKQVMVIMSACHSGSFLAPLGGPSRIVIAAAASDKSSFGCQFQSTNTYFIDALFNQARPSEQTIVQMMDKAKIEVDRREKAQKLSPPSLPDLSIGAVAKDWANQPLKSWLSAR